LLAVLIGAQLAGVLGALMAIPVAGTLLAIAKELLHYHRTAVIETPPGVDLAIDRPAAES
jgi:predicted PurR-regulated permease PerM